MTNYKKEQRLKEKEKTEKTNKHRKEVSITSEKQFDTEAQRALVFQGGGALAAYEVGVYAVLYFWIKKDLDENTKDENIFDIIAGTSGGAINAAIIVSHVMQKRNESKDLTLKDSWKGSVKQLLDFYNHVSSDADYTKWGPYSTFGEIVQEQVLSLSSSFSSSSSSTLPSYSYYRWRWPPDENSWKSRWDQANRVNKSIATGEAARRYYSAKEYLYSGAPNVFLPSLREYDNRFFDDFVIPTNIWFHFDNTPLKESINQYAKFPIATSFFHKEKPQPRLLMVSVDVETGAILTFDSYEKDPQGAATTRKSESDDYTKRGKEIDDENKTSINKSEIEYSCGIMVEHIIASSSVPINYNYAEVPISYDKDCRPSEKRRKFWDGGTQSNTPLRELIQAHEDYWNKVIDKEKRKEVAAASDEIPPLQVYIANIWPLKSGNGSQSVSNSSSNAVPSDYDGVKNRLYDLRLQDKTLHEEKVAYLIHDYIELAKSLKTKAEGSGIDISDILNSSGQSKHRDGKRRKYGELLERKVKIADVIRLQREPDPDDVSSKLYDYSSDTISELIRKGVKETLEKLAEEEVIKITEREKGSVAAAKKKTEQELRKFMDIINQERINEQLTEQRESKWGQKYIILKGTNMYDTLTKYVSEIQSKIATA